MSSAYVSFCFTMLLVKCRLSWFLNSSSFVTFLLCTKYGTQNLANLPHSSASLNHFVRPSSSSLALSTLPPPAIASVTVSCNFTPSTGNRNAYVCKSTSAMSLISLGDNYFERFLHQTIHAYFVGLQTISKII